VTDPVLEKFRIESDIAIRRDNRERHKNLEFLSDAGLLKVLGAGIKEAAGDTSSILPTFGGADPLAAGIRSVYQEVLNRTPDAWEIGIWKTKITGGSYTLASMRKEFVADPQCRAAIAKAYSDVIGRAPDEQEVNARQKAILDGKSIATIRADSVGTHAMR
jgi:hypothetical protein